MASPACTFSRQVLSRIHDYVQAESDMAMRQVLGAKASARRETVTPPTAAAGQRDWEQADSGDDGFDERGDTSPE